MFRRLLLALLRAELRRLLVDLLTDPATLDHVHALIELVRRLLEGGS